MLEMAEVLYDVNLEDENGNGTGICFDGFSYALYPIGSFDGGKTIQWHLEKKPEGAEQDHSIPPDHNSGQKWVRIKDLDTLSNSTTILSYYGQVTIQLGTESRRGHTSISGTRWQASRTPHRKDT
jgi:hypothetical protein